MTFDPRALLASLTTEQIAQVAQLLLTHDPLLSATNAATYLGVSMGALYNWRQRGTGPATVRFEPKFDGGKREEGYHKYRLSVLNAFIATRPVKNTTISALSPKQRHALLVAAGYLPPDPTPIVAPSKTESSAVRVYHRTAKRWVEEGTLGFADTPEGPKPVYIPKLEKEPAVKRVRTANIKEAARLLGVCRTTVRRNDAILKPSRNAAGARVYDLDSLPAMVTKIIVDDRRLSLQSGLRYSKERIPHRSAQMRNPRSAPGTGSKRP